MHQYKPVSKFLQGPSSQWLLKISLGPIYTFRLFITAKTFYSELGLQLKIIKLHPAKVY